MRRRTLLQAGAASAALLAAAGLGLTFMSPAWQASKLGADGRAIFEAIARAVLDGSLPTDPSDRHTAVQSHLARVEDTIQGFPQPVQEELNLLLNILASTAGRLGLAGLASPWQQADVSVVQEMLQKLRTSSLDLRQQTYQALRDITYAAYFADRSTWHALGYAGPVDV